MIVKSIAAGALLVLASAALAQPQSGLTPPSVTPSDTPAVTPSQSPSATPSQSPPVTPSETPSVTPSQPPSVQSGGISPTAPRPVGGMSQCQNMIGADRDKCLQDERAASGGAAGAGSTTPPAGQR